MKINKAFMENKLAFVLAFSILGVGFSTAVAISYSATNQPATDSAYSVPENLDLEEMAKFTSSDKTRAVQIFLGNSEVQKMIGGRPYEVTETGVGTPDLSTKPPKFYITVYMTVGNENAPEKTISGAVDLQAGKVVIVKESPVTILGQ
jgi:hypothetical protein